LERNIRRRERD